MSQIGVVRICLSLPDPGLKCLHLVVYKEARRNLASVGDELQGSVIGNACERRNGNGTHDWRTMRTGDAVYCYAVPLQDVG